MTKKITFGDLHRLLNENGFEQTSVNGPYVVFEHDASGALQAFRSHRVTELVDSMTFASVRKTLVGFGYMDEDEFEEAVQEAAGQRKAKARQR
jgi:hypothetical protein